MPVWAGIALDIKESASTNADLKAKGTRSSLAMGFRGLYIWSKAGNGEEGWEVIED